LHNIATTKQYITFKLQKQPQIKKPPDWRFLLARSIGRFLPRSEPAGSTTRVRTLRWEEVFKYPETVLGQIKELIGSSS